MALKTGTNIGIFTGTTTLAEHGYKDAMDNAWRALDLLAQATVLDKDLAAPPASPADGASYIVAANPTGAWASKAGYIARYNAAATSWEFWLPKNGWRAHVQDEGIQYRFDGSAWTSAIAVGSLSAANLTQGRVVTVGANGRLVDSAALTFDGSNLVVPDIKVGSWAGGGVRGLLTDNTGMGYAASAADVRATLGIVGAELLSVKCKGTFPAGWHKIATLALTSAGSSASVRVSVNTAGFLFAGDYGGIEFVARLKQASASGMSAPIDYIDMVACHDGGHAMSVGYSVDQDDATAKIVSLWVYAPAYVIVRYTVLASATQGDPVPSIEFFANHAGVTIQPANYFSAAYAPVAIGSLKVTAQSGIGNRLVQADANGTNSATIPVPTAFMQTLFDDADQAAARATLGALAASEKGAANGVAPLGADSKIASTYLPSYVDDVLEYANLAAFPGTGEAGKIYVALDTNKTYRWSGSAYVVISETLALGETSSTAYRGDRGKTAYDHSQLTAANPHGTTFAQIASIPAAIDAIDGLTPAADRFAYYTGANSAALAPLSAFGRSLIDDADAAAARATLGAQPALGYTPVNKAGDVMEGLLTAADNNILSSSSTPQHGFISSGITSPNKKTSMAAGAFTALNGSSGQYCWKGYLGDDGNFINELTGVDQQFYFAEGGCISIAPNDNNSTASGLKIAGLKVVSGRKTGWTAATGTATRTAFATSSVTLQQLAERVKAILDDLISHGLIGA